MRPSVLALALILFVPACSGEPGDDDPGAIDHGPIIGVGLSPYNPTLLAGEDVQLYAEGFHEDGFHVDVSDEVSWLSTEPRVADVSSSGLATAGDAGTTDVVATYQGGISAKVTVSVKGDDVSISSVSVGPSSLQLLVGGSAQLTAMALYNDGSSGNISGSCQWQSTDGGIVDAQSAGRVEGVGVGTASVSADCSGHDAGSSSVTVEEEDVVLPIADLEVRSLSGTSTTAGDVELHAQIHNVGTGYASSFWVQAYLDSATEPTDPNGDDDYTWVPGLGAGEQVAVSFLITDPGPGTYQSWVVADLLEEVDEDADRNNWAGPVSVTVDPVTTGSPNLVITEFFGLGDPSITLYSITVTNQGTVASDACWMDLFYTPSDIPEAGPSTLGDDYVQMPALGAGATFSWEPEAASGPSSSSPWYSCVITDSMADVVESDEDDNVDCVDVELFR